MTPQEKLIDLETRLAYQEQTIEELSGVVFEQSKRIDQLEDEIGKINSRVESFANSEPLPDPLDEKPPHY